MKDQKFNFQNSTDLQNVSMDYAYKKGYKLSLVPPPYEFSKDSEGILVVISTQEGTKLTSRTFLIPFGLNEQEVQDLIDEEIKNLEINKML
ncbi:hypothetical protein P4829_06535 [Bacillus atrophaeus]|uniref:hypothetical protein n=1 Tax=Bacillus atrophaeus TaxID=1452 RepID=UPI0007C53A75|nr:hypothetical protein [Bacillus atrophaeus]WFE15344.1 hypothetical protein P4829_06535 [Bacillus atrophaeus]